MTEKHKITGNEITLTFIEGKGLSPYSVLEGAWVLVGLMQGIRNPELLRDETSAVAKLWESLELINAEGMYTLAGLNIVKMEDLFEYEFSMMGQQLDGDSQTDPEKYKKLRGALAAYSETYLGTLMDWVHRNTLGTAHVLDFGGGSGGQLSQLLAYNPLRSGVLYDKTPTAPTDPLIKRRVSIVEENFLETKSYLLNNEGAFDTIIVSEVLHCVAEHEWSDILYILENALASNGSIFILEQHNGFRLDHRLQSMTKGRGLGLSYLKNVLYNHCAMAEVDLKVFSTTNQATHYGIMLKKGEYLESSKTFSAS